MREHLTHNVVLNLVIAACCGFADSIWTGTIGVAFLYDVYHTNKQVGIATALTGLAALASALPAGYAADRYGRAKIVRAGSVAIFIAAPMYAYATIRASAGRDKQLSYVLICIASAFFDLSSGIINGPAQALLADSVPTGARSKVYTWLFACYIIPSVLGPAISVGYFIAHGDEWKLPLLRDLTLLGMLLEIPVAVLCCCFRDDLALGRRVTRFKTRSALREIMPRAPPRRMTTTRGCPSRRTSRTTKLRRATATRAPPPRPTTPIRRTRASR